jgi:hypothetical protein
MVIQRKYESTSIITTSHARVDVALMSEEINVLRSDFKRNGRFKLF